MKVHAWTESERERPILTGDGMVIPRKGDIVMVAIVRRWEDMTEALKQFARLNEPEQG